MKSPTITTERFVLRPFTQSDAALWQIWDVDPEVQAFMPEPPNEARDIESQYAYITECENDTEGYYWSIETHEHVTIGTVSLTEYNKYHEVAELGIMIGNKEYWGKGVGTEVVQSLVTYAFSNLHVTRINAEVEDGNDPMVRVLKNVGFAEDGIFESARLKKGRRILVRHFGIVNK